MTFESASKPIFWLVLILALAFAAHLYPGPDARAEMLLAKSNSGQPDIQSSQDDVGGGTSVTTEERAAVNAMVRRGWLVNLMLMMTGGAGAATWLLLRRNRVALASSLVLLVLFVAVFVLAVLPSRISNPTAWLELMTRVASVKGWAFLAAELHRVCAFIFGLLAIGLVVTSFRRLGPAS